MKKSKIISALVFWAALIPSGLVFATAADNSKVNQRDQNASEVTADQQSTNKADTEITRQIRQVIMKDKDLSVYAKNIKIITINGEVTLKGPVRSTDEAKRILRVASARAGNSRIVNEMEIVQQ